MVFGLALSFGALVLINQPPTDAGRLYLGLLVFGFSFMILVTVWYNYSTIMAVLPVETRGLIVANIVLLFVVALEPYLLYVLVFYGPTSVTEPTSVLYGLDLAAMNAILGGFLHILSREEKPLVSAPYLRKMRVTRNFTVATASVFLLSSLPVFWSWAWWPGVPSRIVLWILTIPAGWIVRIRNR